MEEGACYCNIDIVGSSHVANKKGVFYSLQIMIDLCIGNLDT